MMTRDCLKQIPIIFVYVDITYITFYIYYVAAKYCINSETKFINVAFPSIHPSIYLYIEIYTHRPLH